MPRIGAKRGQPPLLPRALQFQKPGGGGARMPESVDAKGAARPHPDFRCVPSCRGNRKNDRIAYESLGQDTVFGRGHAWRVVTRPQRRHSIFSTLPALPNPKVPLMT